MGYFLALSKPAATHCLEASEWALLLFGILVIIGIWGEIKSGQFSPRLKMFEYIVLWGIVGELAADGGVFLFSAQLQIISEAEIAGLNKEAGDARQKAGEAIERASKNEKEAAAMRDRAEQERLARVKIEERLAWRQLTGDQQRVLANELKAFSGQRFVPRTYTSDSEPQAFTDAIVGVLKSVGWIIPGDVGSGMPSLSGIVTGVEIHVARDAEVSTRTASEALLRALNSVGVAAKAKEEPPGGPWNRYILLVIGKKP